MLPDFCKTLSILAILFILSVSCYSQNIGELSEGKEQIYNTTIVLNFKKNADKKYFSSLGLRNPLYFSPLYLPPPPFALDTSTNLKTIIKTTIDKPTYLTLGFSIFHMEPGDSLNMDFEVLLNTKTAHKDTITINHGNVFFIWKGGSSLLFHKYLTSITNSLKDLKTADQIAELTSRESLRSMADSCTALIYKEHPILKRDSSTFETVKKYSIHDLLARLAYRLALLYANTRDESIKSAIETSERNMLEYASLQEGDYDDPRTLGTYRSIFYFYKEMGLDAQAILERFNDSNDTLKQYIQLNLFYDGLLSEEQELGLINKLTYPAFKEYALQLYQNPNRGIIKSGYINNEIRGARLFDVNDKELAFDELFKKTAQPYLLFDFSGSWCKPCLEEMSVYAKTRHLDNSKKVRPIWLFFENDKTKWLNIIERYNLKKENCFLVVGEAGPILQKQFALLFDWEGEFPHYFLFAKEGEIIEKRARPLSLFEENDVDNLPSRVKNKNSGPPLPPPIK
ncbi:TlpA family protein disulfide reductase [Algoriphagus winogradskyi]|uniref:Thioredoxin domain-containing protein n=1 Tax=Algoriphagus winogradskyi TaxID=237017 RepID=A0ABY1PKB9_9BACT|nr:hypothetical protein [Algoriphagus winogradskyi]SMP36124.1 hypothetical protein SAMN06265367_11220 [Algoriphagus winogradskyi]